VVYTIVRPVDFCLWYFFSNLVVQSELPYRIDTAVLAERKTASASIDKLGLQRTHDAVNSLMLKSPKGEVVTVKSS